MILGLALIFLVLGAGCKKKEPPPTNAAKTPQVGANPIKAPVEYLGAVAQAQKVAVKTIDTVSLNQAVDLFNAQEERYPTDLKELVTKGYLPRLPDPPFGMKFEYNPESGRVKVVKQ